LLYADSVSLTKEERKVNPSGANYLPRLDRAFYQGDAIVHWTLSVFDRGTGWLSASLHDRFRELMLHAAAREGLFCPTYCLMPDHLHLVWMGLRQDSDQFIGMAFLRTYLEPLLRPCRFQPQAHDHVLREHERACDAFAKVCFYILNNPVKEELIEETERWPFLGAVVPGYPTLHPLQGDFWPIFWKLYHGVREPE
jgi:putative transposase